MSEGIIALVALTKANVIFTFWMCAENEHCGKQVYDTAKYKYSQSTKRGLWGIKVSVFGVMTYIVPHNLYSLN